MTIEYKQTWFAPIRYIRQDAYVDQVYFGSIEMYSTREWRYRTLNGRGWCTTLNKAKKEVTRLASLD